MEQQPNPLQSAFKVCKKGFIIVGIFSAIVNLFMLTVPIYMLQLFDRVLVGQSPETLIYLTIIAIVAILTMSLLDVIRGRILARISHWMERKLSLPALNKSSDAILAGSHYGNQCLKDINQLRQFLSSTSIYSLFDIPWVPIFLVVIFLLYPTLGVIALLGALFLIVIAIAHIKYSNKALKKANQAAISNQYYIDESLENAEAIEAMGMLPGVIKKWYHTNDTVLKLQAHAGDRTALLFSLSKFVRLVLQILILGVGAYLVIQGEITAGAMIASSIIMSRALAPIEQAIGAWKQAQSARQSYQRLEKYFNVPASRQSTTELPKVDGKLSVEDLVFISPTTKKVLLQGINFKANPGQVIAIVGHSGAGKSTLGRLILGIWPPSRGNVRLDGADVYQWERVHFGQHTGYLPQNTSLFPGTVKENICRLKEPNDKKMIQAAQFAGAHDMILRLSEGYDTPIEDYSLSGGQSRRVALARAFYDNPRLVVLDEPETHLDQEGGAGLAEAIKKAKANKMTVIIISQHRDIISLADQLLVLFEGKMKSFGENTVTPKKG